MENTIKKIGEVLMVICCIGLVAFIIYSDFINRMPYRIKFFIEGAIAVVMISISYFTLPKNERRKNHFLLTIFSLFGLALAALILFARM